MVTKSGIRAFDAMLERGKPQRSCVVGLMPIKVKTYSSFVVGIPHKDDRFVIQFEYQIIRNTGLFGVDLILLLNCILWLEVVVALMSTCGSYGSLIYSPDTSLLPMRTSRKGLEEAPLNC